MLFPDPNCLNECPHFFDSVYGCNSIQCPFGLSHEKSYNRYLIAAKRFLFLNVILIILFRALSIRFSATSQTLDFCVSNFTCPKLMEALLKLHYRPENVQVRLVITCDNTWLDINHPISVLMANGIFVNNHLPVIFLISLLF